MRGLGWPLVGLALLAWGLVAGTGFALSTATLAVMRANPSLYLPRACTAPPCVLTGLGGMIWTWDDWADAVMQRGWGFRVEGICASACERQYERALRAGVRVEVEPGAVLIPHTPQKL